MRNGLATFIICLCFWPTIALAERQTSFFRGAMPPAAIVPHGHGHHLGPSVTRRSWQQRIGRHPSTKRFHRKPVRPIHPTHGHGVRLRPPIHGRPHHWRPTTTTVIKEAPTTIIVIQPPPAAAQQPPKPKEVWIPPVMGQRTEPGYWDYGVKKVWMGDHWRYEQDVTSKSWVPASSVPYVEQAGYWKVVE